MNELRKILKDVYNKWGAETVRAIINKIDSYPVKWRGTLRRSISYSQPTEDQIDFNMADYGKFVDEGVGQFGPRGQRIPRESIPKIAYYLKPWAQSKGLNPYAVATNIVKRGGIKPRPFFNSVIEARVPQLGDAVVKAHEEYLNKTIDNLNKQ